MPQPRKGGIFNRVLEEVADRTGMATVPQEQLELLEAVQRDYRALSREMDLLGWSVHDMIAGQQSQESTIQSRRQWALKSRKIWRDDVQAGAAVDLMNDFCFGRGVPKPRAKDPEVQKVLDEAWDDPDNQLILTSYVSQVKRGTDLILQSNLFFLMFEGEDGKVKLGLLNHDEVENYVADPDFRQRVLYYVVRKRKREEWDFVNDQPKIDFTPQMQQRVEYYEEWRNVKQAEAEGKDIPRPPAAKMGDGKVYHVAINVTGEEVFGEPTMRRLIKWFSAYNDYLAARVDMMQAAAAFIMKRKVKGSPNQVARLASKAISRGSELAGVSGTGDSPPQVPPRAGSILTENENVSHENMNLNTNAGNAQTDAQMIRASISAGIRFPQSYLGDATNSNLATATSLELPVLKLVESRQEVFEGVFRWFLDRVIEEAVDSGRISKTKARDEENSDDQSLGAVDDTGSFGPPAMAPEPTEDLQQSYEDQGDDEEEIERDLSYEFSMPNPLKRQMTDLATVINGAAQTFDPNGTNIELSRYLLTTLLGEGLEVQDPAEVVKKIFPPGYQDPALQATGGFGPQPGFEPQRAQPQLPGFGPQPGQPDPNNPYSAPGMSQNYQANQGQIQQAAITSGRMGQPIYWPARQQPVDMRALVEGVLMEVAEEMNEARFNDLPETKRTTTDGQVREIERMFDEDVSSVVTQGLTQLLHTNNGYEQ
jgi:hypothetical protein